jgi:hypothetical protein
MREYDDDENIRLYAPVLQRVIILAAVIIAVPVVMWTITTFIRSYVARPKVPTFQHLALTEAPESPPPASQLTASPPPPPQGAQPAAQPVPASPLADSTGASPSPLPVPTIAGAGSNPAIAGSAPNAAQDGAPTPPAPVASPDAPALPTVAQPAGMAARLAANGSGTSAAAPADRGNDRSLADRSLANRGLEWPNPNADGPPGFGTHEPPAAMTETASTEALPPPQPIKGRIPLPRRRPAVMALAATGSVAPPTGRAVPMPKLRPVETPPPAAPPAPVSAPYGYQPGLDSGR